MRFHGEIPQVENRRAGPGWWMDETGVWRPPHEWPEDYPPIRGWVRDEDGVWGPPSAEEVWRREHTRWSHHEAPPQPVRESRQAKVDKRDMLLVTGALLGVLVVLVGALILITQAGAADEDTPPPVDFEPDGVIYAAESRATQRTQREAAAVERPGWAEATLASLPEAVGPPDGVEFDPGQWIAPDDGCLSVDERVLLARSSEPPAFVDQMECVLDAGRWTDRYEQRDLTRAIDVDVRPRIPFVLVHAAGGWNWDRTTREAFVSDLDHPAMHEIVAAGSDHNPDALGPAGWRPSDESTWCSYAVDWIAVVHRWSLGVSDTEREALGEMLGTCSEPDSRGADAATTPIAEPARPDITFLDT